MGKIDGAFLFNGLSDSVEISDSGSLDFGAGSFTFAGGWIKTSQIGEGQFIRFGGGSDGAGFIFGTNGGQSRAVIRDTSGNQVDNYHAPRPDIP